MPTYYIDDLFATASDYQGTDSQGNPVSIDLTYKITAKVYQNNTLISEHKNISKNWQTPIDTEVPGHYSIEYIVTDEFGATNSVIRNIEITPGLFTNTKEYESFIESGTNKTYVSGGTTYNRGNIFQLGYYQNITADGKYMCLNFLGNWFKMTANYRGYTEYNDKEANHHSHGAVLINTEDVDSLKVTEAIDILGGPSVYSAPPGKFCRIAEVVIQSGYTSSSMVDMNNVPIAINSSPYTRARFASAEIVSAARVDGFAYTLRLENNQWIVDSLFSSPYNFSWNWDDDTRTLSDKQQELRFGRCVRISKNGQIIAMSSDVNAFNLYRRTGYFVHLIFKRSSSSAISTPTTTNTAVPNGWVTNIDDTTGNDTLYACRVQRTSNGYSISPRYRVANEDYPHLSYSDGSWTVSSQDNHINIPVNIENQYGWTRFATITSPGLYIDCMCLNKAGTRLFVGSIDRSSVYVYNINSNSVSLQATITRESKHFGESIQCDESGDILLVGGKGYIGDDDKLFNMSSVYYEFPGSLHCFVYRNGSWNDDSMSGLNAHQDKLNLRYVVGDTNIYLQRITDENAQTSASSVMYAQPNATRKTFYADGSSSEWPEESREYITTYHGRGFALSQDTNTLYVSSSHYQTPIHRWSSTKTYYTGNVVSVFRHNSYTMDLYESLIDDNTNHNPNNEFNIPTTAQYWQRLTSESMFPAGSRSVMNEFTGLYWNPALNTYSYGRKSIRATILVYKKVESSYHASGFYWNYQGVITPPKSLMYEGWDIQNLDDISVPDNEATILIGGSMWERYRHAQTASSNNLIGEELVTVYGVAHPGGFALLDNKYFKKREDDVTPFYDLDPNTQDFVSQERDNPNTLMPDAAFPPPEPLPKNSTNHELLGGYVCALKSTTPDSTFIVYIKHNDDRFLNSYYYVTAGNFLNSLHDNPNQVGASSIDFSSEYQSFEEDTSVNSRNVYIFNQYKRSYPTTVYYNSNTSISGAPPAAENFQLSYNKSTSQMTMSWNHGIKNAKNTLLTQSNQAEQYEVKLYKPATGEQIIKTIPADYSNVTQFYTFDNIKSRSNYSINEPEAENAEIMFFGVKAVNYRLSYSQTQYSETIGEFFYNFDFNENDAPDIPLFKAWGNGSTYSSGAAFVYLDVFAPYQNYIGGRPTSLTLAVQKKIGDASPINNPDDLPEESYYSLNKVSFTEIFAFDDDLVDRITSFGFRHRLFIEEEDLFGNITVPILSAGSTYYFWVKLENEFGSSNWQPLLENDSGGITFDS